MPEEGSKVCNGCRLNLTLEHFSRNASGRLGRNSRCKDCKGRRAGARPGPEPVPLADRFWAKVDRRSPDECWPWLGGTDPRGYGTVWSQVLGRKDKAHRVSLSLQLGRSITDGLEVLHSCDNPRCVNPEHLREGTHQENMQDMAERNQQWRENMSRARQGERHPRARLTNEQAGEVRRRHRDGEQQSDLADAFGVGRSVVGGICRGETYKEAM